MVEQKRMNCSFEDRSRIFDCLKNVCRTVGTEPDGTKLAKFDRGWDDMEVLTFLGLDKTVSVKIVSYIRVSEIGVTRKVKPPALLAELSYLERAYDDNYTGAVARGKVTPWLVSLNDMIVELRARVSKLEAK